MVKHIFYLDGQYLAVDEKLLNAFTPGRQRWHGVFETMRASCGRVEFLDDHLSRLMQGSKIFNIRHGHAKQRLKRIIHEVLKKNPFIKLGRVRVMVFVAGGSVHCAVMVLEYHPPSLKQYRKGLRVMVVRTDRPATARWAEVKSLDHGLFACAYDQAKAAGCDEALLVNSKGHVFEAARANVFVRSGAKLITPPLSSGCLNGIVRRRIIAAARRFKVPVAEKDLSIAMVKNADEAYLTNSMAGIIKIHSIVAHRHRSIYNPFHE